MEIIIKYNKVKCILYLIIISIRVFSHICTNNNNNVYYRNNY